jgi:hypothetical protein
VWNHEESRIEHHTQFDDIDVFLWSMVRIGALRAGVIGYPDVEADFDALAQPGALVLLAYQREEDQEDDD